ncbi:MAG: GBS Bsp-like repeat-containing protein [Eubacteriaceae bacterium]|nr:GBS Bsp-like repeat-containing protein [Eubacteriaceae bacterium]
MKKVIGSIVIILFICAFGLTAWAQSAGSGAEGGKGSIVRTVINIPGQPTAEDIQKAKSEKNNAAQGGKSETKTDSAAAGSAGSTQVKTDSAAPKSDDTAAKPSNTGTDASGATNADNQSVKTTASEADIPHVVYSAHVQDIGWMDNVRDCESAGTTGRSLRMEAFKVKLDNAKAEGSIEYRANIQDIGWESKWYKNGEMSGTVGKELRLDAVQLRLTGEMASQYDLYYRVHVQDIGWMDWVKNGESAGAEGQEKRVEAIQIGLVSKGASVNTMSSRAIGSFVEMSGPGTFKMAVETSMPDQIESVTYTVLPDGGDQTDKREYTADTHQNGTWSAEASIADFGFQSGSYRVSCDIRKDDGTTEHVAVSDGFEVEPLPISAAMLEGTNTEYRFTIGVPEGANIREIILPTWTYEAGQDDIVWHTANRVDATTFQLDLNIRDDHYNGQHLITHAYLKDTDGVDHFIGALSTPLALSEVTQYIGHRGLSSQYPENSLAAFKNNKWQYAECDIWPTADNQWVIMHDSVIDRTTDGSGAITDMTLDELRQYHIDTGANIAQCATEDLVIPTLSEYLSVCNAQGIIPVIEIKAETISDEAYANLEANLAEYGYNASNMVVISFFSEPLRQMEARYPGVELMYLTMSINDEFVQTAKSISGNCAVSSQYSGVTQREIDLCHNNGIKAGVWTVPDQQCAGFRNMKVDYITLN